MKSKETKKEMTLKNKLENLKNVVTSKQFKSASKDLIKSLKNARDTMDVFK